MSVALLAQRHHRKRTTSVLALALAGLVAVGGITSARSVQLDLATDVQRALGLTAESVEITVDGRDVTLESVGPITDQQVAAVAAVPDLASLTIVTRP